MSTLLSSLSMEILHLVVDCNTSHDIWTTLETTLVSPSNSRIMQLYGSFQELRQNDESVSTYLQKAKSLFDELAAAGRPISMEDFNLYVFRGLLKLILSHTLTSTATSSRMNLSTKPISILL